MQAIPAIKLRIAEHPQLGRDPVVRIAETRRYDAVLLVISWLTVVAEIRSLRCPEAERSNAESPRHL